MLTRCARSPLCATLLARLVHHLFLSWFMFCLSCLEDAVQGNIFVLTRWALWSLCRRTGVNWLRRCQKDGWRFT